MNTNEHLYAFKILGQKSCDKVQMPDHAENSC